MTTKSPHSQGPTTHGENCGCTRCVGFRAGNEVALRHGAKRCDLALAQTADFREIVGDLRERVPGYSHHDEVAVQLLAIALTRVRKAAAAFDALDAVEETARTGRLRQDARGWV